MAPRSVIVFEGSNDIQQNPRQTDPAPIIDAYRQLAARARAARSGSFVRVGCAKKKRIPSAMSVRKCDDRGAIRNEPRTSSSAIRVTTQALPAL
jgi:hypothetical protein